MKTVYLLIILVVSTYTHAQVAIGKTTITNSSVSLEFGTGNKGIVLPWVTSAADVTGAIDGTFIYDLSDHKVKYRKSGYWVDLSVDNTGTATTTVQDGLTENTLAKTIIGKNTSDATPGILVLSDTDKAMILPKVANPHLNINNPTAGMMVYDTQNKLLAVFNGTVWTFWMP